VSLQAITECELISQFPVMAVSLPVCWIGPLAPELNSHSDLQKTGI